MSDILQTIQIMLADAAQWRGRMEDRMDEAITTLHTVATALEGHTIRTGAVLSEVEKRLDALENTVPGKKKGIAVAVGSGGIGGALTALAGSGALDFIGPLLKRFFG